MLMIVLLALAGVASAQLTPIVPNTNRFRTLHRGVLNEPLSCHRGAGWYVMGNDCSRYYRCHSWVRHHEEARFTIWRFTCGPGTLFSESLATCVHAASLPTSDPFQQCGPQARRAPVYDPNRCNAVGFFPNPKDCTKFKQCRRRRNGSIIGAEFDCPEGTLFNPAVPVCDDPEELAPTVACLAHYVAPTTTTPEPTTTYDPNRCEEIGFFPNPFDCTKFKQCRRKRDGSIIGAEFDCPPDTLFNPTVPVCDDPDNLPRDTTCLSYQ